MFNLLGVPAQANHATNQVIFVAVVLSAVSFLFFVTLSAVEGLLLKKQKRMPLPSLTQMKIWDL